MPSPANTVELLDLVTRSGVADDQRIAAYVQALRANGQFPSDPVRLAELLVGEGLLTRFQAEQLLQGKWKRFNIGKYKVLERLGSGGMGSVYLCEHTLMRRRVAVKVLPAAKADDPSALERFYREGRVVGALDHPNIVRAYDIDQDDKLHFLVMEHVDGASLQEIIKRGGPLSVARACHYMRQAALGLQHAHEQAGIVHRDIKPANILVDRNGIVKVLDMGLARFFHDEDDILTRKYDENVLGTADYLAPEQALDSHTVDIRADIYSLGATFYFTLTGRPPFAEGTVAQKLMWHQTRQPRSIRQQRPEVPEAVCAIIDKMMAKDPAQRYQTPLELVEALAPFTQMPIDPPPESEMPQLSRAAMSVDPTPTRQGPATTLPSPSPRRQWQVAGTTSGTVTPQPTSQSPIPQPGPTQQTTPAPLTPPSRRRPPSSPVIQPAAPTPAPDAAGPIVPVVTATPQSAPTSAPNPTAEPAWDDVARDEEAGKPSSRRNRRLREPGRSLNWLWLTLGAVLLLAVGSGVVYLVFASPTTRPVTPTRQALIVDPQGSGGSTYRTVFAAWRDAGPGDRIILRGETTEVPPILDGREGITLEAEEGKTFVWKSPTRWPVGPSTRTLVDIRKLANVTFRGITFDGVNTADVVVSIFGHCPGLKFERCSMQNFKKTGIAIFSAEGNENRPITFTQTTIKTGEKKAVGIVFDVYHNPGFPQQNRFITFQDLTIEGPTTKIRCPNPEGLLHGVLVPAAFTISQTN